MSGIRELYGAGPGRVPFEATWQPVGDPPFETESGEHSVYLRCPRDFPAAWAQRSVEIDTGRPFVLTAKVRCYSEERGPHLMLGVRAGGRGAYMVRQGSRVSPWNELGPYGNDAPGRRMAGFNTNDWHVFTLYIEPGWSNCHFYYDTEEVQVYPQPWESVPAPAPDDDAILIGSEHPGLELQVDWVWTGQTLPPVPGLYLPTLFAADWELRDASIEVGALQRHPANPVLSPGLPAAWDGRTTLGAWVLREPEGYRMWYTGSSESSSSGYAAHVSPAIFHAVSSDGISWQKTPAEPVLMPGPADAWDGGGVQSPIVLKDWQGYHMWYAGYIPGHREGRTGLARSQDGVCWERVPVNTFPFRGSTANNISYPLQDTIYDDQYTMPQCVVVDEDAPPERRYVLFVHAQGRNPIIGVAYSPDGLAFKKDFNNARYYAVDENWPEVGRLHQQTSVLHRDGCWFAFFGFIRRDGAALSLTTYFTAWRDETTQGQNPSFGAWRSYLQLDTHPQNWEGDFVHPSCFVEDGDEWKVYFNGSRDVWHSEIGVATAGRERLWYLRRRLGAATGQAHSRPFAYPPGGWPRYALEVNVSALGPASSIRLALLDPETGRPIPGYSWDENEPIETDNFHALATWRGAGGDLPSISQDLAVAVLLAGGAKLHSVRFKDLHTPDQL
ncbi:MAG: hypothetical protein EXR62_09585 [Chloroflexi bacterium]|nr:hypothetical protein [Chloroflexota bacterium]